MEESIATGKTIAWDVDDVLNELQYEWFCRFQRDLGFADRSCDFLTLNPPHELLGISLETYLQSLDSYRQESYQNLKPIREVVTWFEMDGAEYRHLVVTSVPWRHAPVSAAWVMHHFGRWIRTYHFVPSSRPNEFVPIYDVSKAEFLRWLGKVDLFIDDHPGNIAAARQAGVPSILWPRPWNDSRSTVTETLKSIIEILNEQPSSGIDR